MKLGVLIPSRGDRPAFVEQAQRMLAYQTRQADKVYILDAPASADRYDTDLRTRAGIQLAMQDGVDKLVTWDDDEYYAPTYLEWLTSQWPEDAQVVGVCDIPYYHLRYRRAVYRRFAAHATNSCTAFVPAALQNFDVVQTGYMFDKPLWAWIRAHCSYALLHQMPVPFQVIGMKHGVGSLTVGAHDWPEHRFSYDDSAGHWLRANVDCRVLDFYQSGAWL